MTPEENAKALAEPLRAHRAVVVDRVMNPQDLPRWRCHKVVQAAKITDVVGEDLDTAYMVMDGGQRVPITQEFLNRLAKMRSAIRGGYYVRYEDGYESWSPAKAFEDGYTLITDPETRTCAVCVGSGKSGFIHPFTCPSCNGTGRVRV